MPRGFRYALGKPWRSMAASLYVDYSPEQLAFLKAIDTYKRKVNPRLDASNPVILEIARALGYRKVAAPELPVY